MPDSTRWRGTGVARSNVGAQESDRWIKGTEGEGKNHQRPETAGIPVDSCRYVRLRELPDRNQSSRFTIYQARG